MAGNSPHQDPLIDAFFGALSKYSQPNPLASGGKPPAQPLPQITPQLSDEDLLRGWANSRPGMGWGEDAGRSYVTGVERGATGIAATPNTLRAVGQKVGDWVDDNMAGAMGRGPLTPQEHAALHPPGVLSTPLSILGALWPSQGSLDQGVQQVAGPYHAPQTWQGHTAETAGEMTPNALLPGGLAARVARVVAPTATSSVAGEMTHGTALEPWARAAGAIVGGLGEGIGESAFAAPDRVVGAAARGMTQDQIDAAAALRQAAAERGIQLTTAEAAQQVTNGATGLGRVQRVVENAGRTAPAMQAYFADRPDQIRGAVGDFLGDMAPNMPPQPGMVAGAAQDAAGDILGRTNAAINAQARPFYQALEGQRLPEEEFARLTQNHAFADALDQLKGDPTLAGELSVRPTPAGAPSSGFTLPAKPDPNAAGLAQALDDVRTYGSAQTGSLFRAIQQRGGLNIKAPGPDLGDTAAGLRVPGLVNNVSGMPGERMAQSLADEGWFGPNPGDPSAAFEKAFQAEARGNKVFHPDTAVPGFQQNADQLNAELAQAGVGAADRPTVAAQKLWDFRNADATERAAIQGEAGANDPHGLEFDRLSAPSPEPDPYNDLANVMRVRQQLGIMAQNAKPSPVNPFSNATKSSLYEQAQGLADAVASPASGAWDKALDTVSTGRAMQLEPLQRGPIGGIATTDDLAAQTGALYPQNPFPGQANATGAAAQRLMAPGADGAAQYPDVLANLTGQHLGHTFDQSTRALSSGPNQYGGALFARNIAGNAEQAGTLQAGLGALDPSGELSGRWGDLLDALQATGRRERPGSMTAFNTEDLNALKLAPIGARFLGGLGDPLEWTKNLSNWTGNSLFARNLDVLQSMMLDPDTASVLQRAAAAHAGSSPVPPQALLPMMTAAPQGADQ